MQCSSVIVCLLLQLSVFRFTSAEQRTADQLRADEEAVDRARAEPRGLKPESVLMGIAQSLIGGKKLAASDQNYCIDRDVYQRSGRGFCKLSSLTNLASPCKFFKMANGFCDLPDILSLSLNMSNLVLMLVLRGLIWGVSYMQSGGKEARNAEDPTYSTMARRLDGDAVIETDVMLFLGYLVADKSGRYDCLNRVACERPARAESYLRSAEMMWKTAKMLDGVVSLDSKYEKMLNRLEEAIEDGKTDGDCQAKYKCFAKVSADHIGLT